jgi:hypothetical protein
LELAGTPLIISQDSINDIFTRSHAKGWNYFHKKYGDHYYIFSSPIFLENNCVYSTLTIIVARCATMEKYNYTRETANEWKIQKEFCSWMS